MDKDNLQEKIRMQRSLRMGNTMEWGSDSRSTSPPGSRLRKHMNISRSSRDVSEAESDFSSQSKKLLKV